MNGFEEYYIGDRKYLKTVSPSVYNAISSLEDKMREMLDQQRKQHISYSEIKDWEFCPFYHKLTRVDKIAGFEGNEYTAFGTAIHSVCEAAVQSEYWKVSEHDTESLTKYF